jgi:hypothetical protein
MYALIIVLATILISIVIFPTFPMESFAHRDGCIGGIHVLLILVAMFVEI